MTRPNASNQKLQAVLFLMDADLGKTGIDGERGPKTNAAVTKAANQIYASMAASMTRSEAISRVNMGDIGTQEGMRKIVEDKLKDPAFRAAALEKLKQVEPPTKDSITAMQVVLAAAGHDIKGRDPVTGMMSGKMNESTQFALNNTDGGKPSSGAYAAIGIPESATQLAMAGGGGRLGGPFQNAVAAVTPAPNEQRVATVPAPVARMITTF